MEEGTRRKEVMHQTMYKYFQLILRVKELEKERKRGERRGGGGVVSQRVDSRNFQILQASSARYKLSVFKNIVKSIYQCIVSVGLH